MAFAAKMNLDVGFFYNPQCDIKDKKKWGKKR